MIFLCKHEPLELLVIYYGFNCRQMGNNYTVDLNALGDSDSEWFKSSDFPMYSIQLEGDKLCTTVYYIHIRRLLCGGVKRNQIHDKLRTDVHVILFAL